jgi:hypothetical protein
MDPHDGVARSDDLEVRAYRGVVIEGPGFALAYHSAREACEAIEQLLAAMHGDETVRRAQRELELALRALDDLRAKEGRAGASPEVRRSAGPRPPLPAPEEPFAATCDGDEPGVDELSAEKTEETPVAPHGFPGDDERGGRGADDVPPEPALGPDTCI